MNKAVDKSASQAYVLVTSVGEDRPGLVEELAEWFLNHGGNIVESRMAQLGGDFAGLILVAGPPSLLSDLEATRDAFEARTGQCVYLKPTREAPAAVAPAMLRYVLKATSLDHPGIVYSISKTLCRKRANIVSLVTHTGHAPFSGAPIFHVEMVVDVPAEVNIPALRAELADLGMRENIDIELAAEGN